MKIKVLGAGSILILILCFSCVSPQNHPPVIRDIIYAREVPASFETLLICKTYDGGSNPLLFKWFSDNGTIQGHYGYGESITWVAPATPGMYIVGVKVTDINGMESLRSVNIKVVPFSRTFIDISPDISLQIPIWSNDLIIEQQSVNPATIAEIECQAPLATLNKYKYTWSCNGGKIEGTGVNEGTAFRIGWMPPGVPGCYTVTVIISDDWGNLYAGSVYYNVVNPACCGGNGTCGVQ
jgi:hypothetical protein